MGFLLTAPVVDSAYAWECSVVLDAPKTIGVDEIKILWASGAPEGGSYSWYNYSYITPHGHYADLLGVPPIGSEYLRTGVVYTSPSGKRCSDSKYVWVYDCEMTVSGPTEMSIGETQELTAKTYDHLLRDVVFEWSGPDELAVSADTKTAQFTPQAFGDAVITVSYTQTGADSESCSGSDTHTIKIGCDVNIDGATSMPLGGDPITLRASANPPGGYFTWTNVHDLLPSLDNSLVSFTSDQAGPQVVTADYKGADGEICDSAQHSVDVYKVASVTPPACANTGATLTAQDYTITTEPLGYEQNASVSPEKLSLPPWSPPTDYIEVTASVVEPGTLDNGTADVLVVNPDIKTETSFGISVPNCINEALSYLGIAEGSSLSLAGSHASFKNCCDLNSVVDGASAKADLELALGEGYDFVPIKIPVPDSLEKYVTADFFKITLSGFANGNIEGSWQGCLGDPTWLGSGTLSAKVGVGGEVTVKPGAVALVLSGSYGGETGITEGFSVDDSKDALIFKGAWDGLSVKGEIKILTGTDFEIKGSIAATIIAAKEIPAVEIPLPSLK